MAYGCIAIHHYIVTWWLWVCSGLKCIAAWGRLGKCIAIEELYCNLRGGWLGRVSQYTTVYCDQQGQVVEFFCIRQIQLM